MTVHNRRHRRTLLKESNLLLEYSRIKNRSGWEYKGLWEVIDEVYGHQLTEERLDEAVKLFSWLSNLGKGAIEKMKGLAKSKLDSAQYKEAEETGNALKNQPIANEVRGLWKQGKYKQAFSALSTFLTTSSEQGTIAEGRLLEFGTVGKWWRDTSTAVRLFFMIPIIGVIMGAGGMDKEVQMDTDQKAGIEQVVKVVNNDDAAFNILDIKPVKDDLQAGDEANIQNAGYETGVQFEKGSYDLDANSIKQLNDIAEKYVDDVQALVDAGYTNVTLDLDAAGGASNTGSGWDTPNDGTNKSLRELRADSGGDTLLDAVNKKLAEKGLDGVVKVKLTKKVTNQGGEETVKSGAKDNHQNSIFSGAVDGQPPAAETETVNIDAYNPEFAPIGGDGPTKVLPPTPGVAKGSRNLEYRDLLYLGGIDPIPVTFGDYKSDADMGRVDWRDVDVQGNKFLQDQQKMAVWITNTRKAKFPILKRTKNALQGIIDIEFDGAKYLGNVGPKYDPSTTTPLTQKRTMGKRGPNKFVPDTEKGGYMGNPALTEAKGELPPEFIKEPEIPPKIKSLQGNTTALWKYILGNKALGDVITSQVAGEFDKNIKEYLEQLDLMYGNSGTRGNVNFRYRRNPNYTGSKYKNISDTWNEKITGGVEDIQPTGGEQEVYPQKQSWTGAYTPTPSGEVIDLLPDNELQEQIKRIKKLMI